MRKLKTFYGSSIYFALTNALIMRIKIIIISIINDCWPASSEVTTKRAALRAASPSTIVVTM